MKVIWISRIISYFITAVLIRLHFIIIELMRPSNIKRFPTSDLDRSLLSLSHKCTELRACPIAALSSSACPTSPQSCVSVRQPPCPLQFVPQVHKLRVRQTAILRCGRLVVRNWCVVSWVVLTAPQLSRELGQVIREFSRPYYRVFYSQPTVLLVNS